MDDNEFFKGIPGFESSYQVSNHGRVKRTASRSFKKSKIIEPVFNTNHGYYQVPIYHTNNSTTRVLRNLVAEVFSGIHPSKIKAIEHKDGDESNCRLDNLRIVQKTGVRETSQGTYYVDMYRGDNIIYIGTYDTIKEARAEYRAAMRREDLF